MHWRTAVPAARNARELRLTDEHAARLLDPGTTSFMKPPADRRLDLNGSGVDLPAPTRPRYGVRWSLVLLVATVLSVVSSMVAMQFTLALGTAPTHWRSVIFLNCSYWYLWAFF